MRERLRLFGYVALFWIGFQILIRATFLIYNYNLTADLTAAEIFLTFVHGLKMDLSLSGYFLMLTGLIISISVFTTSRELFYTFHVLTVLLLLLGCVIVVVDLELYRHWGFRLNTTPLFYAGSEAVGSVPFTVVMKLLLILVLIFGIAVAIYTKFVARKFFLLKPAAKKYFTPFLLLTAAMFFPIRGSFTVAPMNTGFVYFHKTKTFANHSAINVVWNFLYSLRKSANIQYPENFCDPGLTKKHFAALYPPSDSSSRLFNISKPNVILFIVESFTADVVGPLGGIKDVTPNFNQLCAEGILFDNFYASGDRTDKGVLSVLSGYPAQPLTSIIKYPGKTQSLPYLNHKMAAIGYHTSFIYGGDIDFANFRSYLTSCRFDHITTEDDFPAKQNQSKWGVHDHIVLDRAFEECDSATAPFFKVVLTLSSHEPFDVPMSSPFAGPDETSLFLNSCFYTDQSIGNFIRKAKEQPWWANTVLLFVADHGHRLPRQKEVKEKERFRIPFLIAGGAIIKDTVIHTFASQTDIANTLLGQLDKPSSDFKFSKNILAPNAGSFAAYFFNDGYGFVTPACYIVHDNTANRFLRLEGATEQQIVTSKAYQQALYTDYNGR
jgi:phosphoglycerol transferase MdoB-like AlkP superfamily enzyme